MMRRIKFTRISRAVLAFACVVGCGLLSVALRNDLSAQSGKAALATLRPNDNLRQCLNREKLPTTDHGELILDRHTWGNNPQEGQYRLEMERLLRMEVDNVRKAIRNVEEKYGELMRAKPGPDRTHYKEIKLEDKPGVWRDGLYVNSQKIIALHFRPEDQKLDCVVLDALVQSIYIEGQWTRKLMRMYNPHIQTVELHTLRRNFVKGGSLEKTAPEIQLQALRTFAEDLRSSLYRMDMEIAAHYNQRNKVNQWQLGM
ncbi:MAG: hypothetical protein RIF32_03775 [Leptospirales bacterium]|jgi:hypothetical protein